MDRLNEKHCKSLPLVHMTFEELLPETMKEGATQPNPERERGRRKKSSGRKRIGQRVALESIN